MWILYNKLGFPRNYVAVLPTPTGGSNYEEQKEKREDMSEPVRKRRKRNEDNDDGDEQPDPLAGSLWDLLPNETRVSVDRELDRSTQRRFAITTKIPGLQPGEISQLFRLHEFERQWMNFFEFATPERLHAFLDSIPLPKSYPKESTMDAFIRIAIRFEKAEAFLHWHDVIGWTVYEWECIPIFLDRQQFLKFATRISGDRWFKYFFQFSSVDCYIREAARINAIMLLSPSGAVVSPWLPNEEADSGRRVTLERVKRTDLGLGRLFQRSWAEVQGKVRPQDVPALLRETTELWTNEGGYKDRAQEDRSVRYIEECESIIQTTSTILHNASLEDRVNGQTRLLERTYRFINYILQSDNPISREIARLTNNAKGSGPELDTVLVMAPTRRHHYELPLESQHRLHSHYWDRLLVMFALNHEFGTDEMPPGHEELHQDVRWYWWEGKNRRSLQLYKLWVWRALYKDEAAWRESLTKLLFDEEDSQALRFLKRATVRKTDGGREQVDGKWKKPGIERYFRVRIL